MIQKYQITDLGEKLGQFSVIFGTKWDKDKLIFFLQKGGVYGIELGHKMRIQHDWKMLKMVVNLREVPYHLQVW